MSHPIEREAPVLLLVVDVALDLVFMLREMDTHCLYATKITTSMTKHINFVYEALSKLHKLIIIINKAIHISGFRE